MSSENCSLLFDYFSGTLSDNETKAFLHHLETCSECQEELQELEMLTVDLPYLSEPITPPEGMKKRILTNVLGEQASQDDDPKIESVNKDSDPVIESHNVAPLYGRPRKRKSRMGVWIFGLAAALLISLVGNFYTLDLHVMQKGADIKEKQVAQVMFDVALAPTENSADQMTASAAMVKNNKEHTLIIQAKDLKPIQGDQVYQVWLIEDGKPVPAGSFRPNQNGSGAVSYHIQQPSKQKWDAVAISLESAPNHQQPKGTIYMQGKL